MGAAAWGGGAKVKGQRREGPAGSGEGGTDGAEAAGIGSGSKVNGHRYMAAVNGRQRMGTVAVRERPGGGPRGHGVRELVRLETPRYVGPGGVNTSG